MSLGVFSAASRYLGPEVTRREKELEPLKALQEACKAAGGLERLATEAQAKTAEAERKLGEVQGKIAAAEGNLESVCKAGDAQREANAKDYADARQALADLRAEGEAIKRRAEEEAKGILARAGDEAAAVSAEWHRAKAVADDELAGVLANIETAKAVLAEALQRKADVEAEISRLKSLFGGKV